MMEATIKFELKRFEVEMRIAAQDGGALWEKLNATLDFLEKRGATPITVATPTAAPQSSPEGPGSPVSLGHRTKGFGPRTKGGAPHICPIHHVEMKKRTKNGKTWYSHKAINPETGEEYWCNEGKGK